MGRRNALLARTTDDAESLRKAAKEALVRPRLGMDFNLIVRVTNLFG